MLLCYFQVPSLVHSGHLIQFDLSSFHTLLFTTWDRFPVIEPRGKALPRFCPIVSPVSLGADFSICESSLRVRPLFRSNSDSGTKLNGSSSKIVSRRFSHADKHIFRFSSSANVMPKQMFGASTSNPQNRNAPY